MINDAKKEKKKKTGQYYSDIVQNNAASDTPICASPIRNVLRCTVRGRNAHAFFSSHRYAAARLDNVSNGRRS